MKKIVLLLLVNFLILVSTNELIGQNTNKPSNSWHDLLEDKLSEWDIFMGAPHSSTEIEGYEKFDDVTKGTPIGLNKDPKKVFTIIEENGTQVLKISGEIFAGLVTKKSYKNYHLKWQFKWGDKKWEPRLNKKRNSGVLYHSIGDYTDFWNVWMTSLECEVQQTDCGDFITIGHNNVKAQAPSIKKDGKFYFSPKAPLIDYGWGDGFETGRCYKPGDPEKQHGKWNTMELICYDNIAIHILNNEVVMVVKNAQAKINNKWIPMTEGKIQIQSEAAEIFYKNIKIKSLKELSKKHKDMAGL
ncbi:DUF1080 domain-containing protein [Flavivirga abyssicola]|uniref:3-keto-disaccharide hydrolase n=1 Tax=Flavivirga abyssicola TaxID=3063533 RepID=UPI0026DF4C47|nr:DUF1080 domain-containing protein [Flavivirga sp. MEBiC07777]WVK11987.1 DUF1080 domain-containing protein [Flavivirga sp. MEBiC07777]